jgi:hypothetical protein
MLPARPDREPVITDRGPIRIPGGTLRRRIWLAMACALVAAATTLDGTAFATTAAKGAATWIAPVGADYSGRS